MIKVLAVSMMALGLAGCNVVVREPVEYQEPRYIIPHNQVYVEPQRPYVGYVSPPAVVDRRHMNDRCVLETVRTAHGDIRERSNCAPAPNRFH